MADKTGLYYPTKEELDEILAARDERFIYSTQEKAVGTWTDGSTVYRKTIDLGSLPNDSTKSVSHRINRITNIISIEGSAKTSSGIHVPLNMSHSNGDYAIRAYVNGDYVDIQTWSDRSDLTGFVTLTYTRDETAHPTIKITTAGVSQTTNARGTITFNDYPTLSKIEYTSPTYQRTALSTSYWSLSGTTLTIRCDTLYSTAYKAPFVATFTDGSGTTAEVSFDPWTAGDYGEE